MGMANQSPRNEDIPKLARILPLRIVNQMITLKTNILASPKEKRHENIVNAT